MRRRRPVLACIVLVVIAALALLFALLAGSVSLSPAEVWRGLSGEAGMASALVNDLRLPRALAAFATGGLLALAGVLMQVLLRNPLADPYVLGVSGGAAVGRARRDAGLGFRGMPAPRRRRAVATMLRVRRRAGRGGWTTTRLLLTGVVVAAGCAAIISLLLSLSDDLACAACCSGCSATFRCATLLRASLLLLAVRRPLPGGGPPARCAGAR